MGDVASALWMPLTELRQRIFSRWARLSVNMDQQIFYYTFCALKTSLTTENQEE